MHLALFPGTFDPVTLGHMDIIRRAAALFDTLIIAVAQSPNKHTLFSLEERMNLMQESCRDLKNVKVLSFSGMLLDLLKEQNVSVLIRGVRTVADYDYEMQLTGMYRMAMPELEIVMLPTSGNLSFISSTLVREVITHKGDTSPFVPQAVYKKVLENYQLQ